MKRLKNKIIEVEGFSTVYLIRLEDIRSISISAESVHSGDTVFYGEFGSCTCGATIHIRDTSYNADFNPQCEIVGGMRTKIKEEDDYKILVTYTSNDSETLRHISEKSMKEFKETYLNME